MVESQSRDVMYESGNASTEQNLQEKLHHLRDVRAELDADIASLERVLSIIRGGSP